MSKQTRLAEIDEFWEEARRLVAAGEAEIGTMMRHPCLRVAGSFFATIGHTDDELIVKLPAARVAELIAAGEGEPFVPAGRRFKEWVAVPRAAAARWPALIAEARAFVVGAA